MPRNLEPFSTGKKKTISWKDFVNKNLDLKKPICHKQYCIKKFLFNIESDNYPVLMILKKIIKKLQNVFQNQF